MDTNTFVLLIVEIFFDNGGKNNANLADFKRCMTSDLLSPERPLKIREGCWSIDGQILSLFSDLILVDSFNEDCQH